MSDIKIGLIGGTGIGEVLGGHEGHRHEIQTPFGNPSDAILEADWSGLPVYVLRRHGPGHVLAPSQVPFRANIFALKTLGVTHIIASGAVGSLREEYRPRDLVIPDQIIDKTTRRAGSFFEKAAVHVEFAEPFSPVLRQLLLAAGHAEPAGAQEPAAEQPTATASGPDARPAAPPPPASASVAAGALRVHDRGCYVCMEGPAFSTRAESLMHRLWGGDLIGMTAMPEAKLAREAEISYALVALVTDYDCWRKPAARPAANAESGTAAQSPDLLEEIIANLKSASDNAMRLIRQTVASIAANPGALADCPARDALRRAIWSDKSQIDPAEVELLAPLWMKYFG